VGVYVGVFLGGCEDEKGERMTSLYKERESFWYRWKEAVLVLTHIHTHTHTHTHRLTLEPRGGFLEGKVGPGLLALPQLHHQGACGCVCVCVYVNGNVFSL
jgi:hypothetical protein